MTYDVGMKRTTIFLSEETNRLLRDVARRSGRSQAEILREALSEYLSREPRPRPRSIGMGNNRDDSVTSANVKDWVREQWESEIAQSGETEASQPKC
jgi:hypothetical protein